MTCQEKRKSARFSDQDLERMIELHQGINSRAEEMARIIARTLQIPEFSVKQYTLNTPAGTSGSDFVPGEHITDKGEKYCHDIVEQVCCAGPCPCG